MLLAYPVKKFGNVGLFDGGTFLVYCLCGELPQRAGDGGAVAECRAAEGLFAGRVGAFLGVEFEGATFGNSCEVGLHIDDAVVFFLRRILQRDGRCRAVDAAFDVLGSAFAALYAEPINTIFRRRCEAEFGGGAVEAGYGRVGEVLDRITDELATNFESTSRRISGAVFGSPTTIASEFTV